MLEIPSETQNLLVIAGYLLFCEGLVRSTIKPCLVGQVNSPLKSDDWLKESAESSKVKQADKRNRARWTYVLVLLFLCVVVAFG